MAHAQHTHPQTQTHIQTEYTRTHTHTPTPTPHHTQKPSYPLPIHTLHSFHIQTNTPGLGHCSCARTWTAQAPNRYKNQIRLLHTTTPSHFAGASTHLVWARRSCAQTWTAPIRRSHGTRQVRIPGYWCRTACKYVRVCVCVCVCVCSCVLVYVYVCICLPLRQHQTSVGGPAGL